MGYIENITREFFNYLPELTRKGDFDEFWKKTIQQTKAVPLRAEKILIDYHSNHIKVYDISYNGMDDTRINGWFIVPTFVKKDKYPCLIHYHGFSGSRGEPSEFMHWIMMGFAVLSVDCRDQGGKTGNCASYTQGFALNNASRGIHSNFEYYYRSVYMDSVKAIDFAIEQEEVDASKIVLEGASQGGALAMAVSALDDRPTLAMVDVPSNSNIVSRIEGYHGAFSSVTEYLKKYPLETDSVMDTLSYFDTMNMADKIKCRVLASVALKDEICPAQMYFATYNRICSEKDIVIYPFNGHEGGGAVHTEVKLGYLKKHFSDWFEH